MAKPQLVNFHFENQLFDPSLSLEQVRRINQDFEYIALLWGGVERLYTYSSYSEAYLKKCQLIQPELPLLEKFNNQKEFQNFWGDLDDIDLARKINSKETSFSIGQELQVNPPVGEIIKNNDGVAKIASQLDFPLVARLNSSIAGRGVYRFYDMPEILDFFEKRKKNIWQAGGIILEPKYERRKDFGVLFRDQIYFYENIIDHRGQFRGIVLRPEEDFFSSLSLEMSIKDFKEIYQKIFSRYQSLGATTIQIDSFIYTEGKKIKLYPLVEVNARKTMGEFAIRLHQALASDKKYSIFYLFKKGSRFVPNDSVELSPESCPHRSAFLAFNDQAHLDQALVSYLDDISQKF